MVTTYFCTRCLKPIDLKDRKKIGKRAVCTVCFKELGDDPDVRAFDFLHKPAQD